MLKFRTDRFISGDEIFEVKFKINGNSSEHALLEKVSKIARKVAEGVLHSAMALQVAAIRCEK